MTDERFHEIADQLDEIGWSYNPAARQFQSTDEDETDDSLSIEWQEILEALSGVTEEELQEYVGRVNAEDAD